MYIRIKNNEAPFVWIIRVAHPVLMSRDIMITDENARFVSAVYTIETNNPDTICKTSTIPSMNPMFHIIEMDEGVGRSNRDFLVRFVIGLIFISCGLI